MRKPLLMLIAMAIGLFGYAQLSGIKTIPGDYPSLAAAVTDLNTQGVGIGGVTFNVAADYTESITDAILITATGTVGNPIVFQKSGAGNNPKITRTDGGGIGTSTLGGQGDAIIIIQGTDYITFDGIDVQAENQGIEYGYYLRKASVTDGCKFVTIKNANITMTKGTSQYVAGIYSSNNDAASLFSSATGITVTSTGGRNENVTITGNTITNVFSGIVLRGFNHTSSPYDFYDQNFIVGAAGAGNTIRNYAGNAAFAAYGVYLIYHTSPTVSYNTIDNAGGGGSNATSTLYGIFNSVTSAAGDCVFSHNNITLNQGSTSLANGIHDNNLGTSKVITYNNINYGAFASTTASYMITASSATPNVTVSYNQNSNPVEKTASGAFYGYYNLGSPASGTETLIGNNFSNITITTGTALFGGLYSSTAVGQNRIATNNIISNVTHSGTGILYPFYLLSSGTNQIYDNSAHDLQGGGTIYGIYFSGTNPDVHDNSFYNISTSGATVAGVWSAGTGNTRLYRNSIYNIESTNTAPTVSGILVSTGTAPNIYNNFISQLKAPSSNNDNSVRGINITSSTTSSTVGLYYNTIYLDASSTGTNFGSSGVFHTYNLAGTTAALDMRNNIIVNVSGWNGTGKTVALRRSLGTNLNNYSTTSNNNAFYAGSPGAQNLLFDDATNSFSNMADFQAFVTPRESASFRELPPFEDVTKTAYDLRLKTDEPTQCESGGQRITAPVAITDDYFETIRALETGYTGTGSAPDIGAHEGEFEGLDLVPPLIAYTPLENTVLTTARTLTTNINDASGVPTSGVGLPVLYWGIGAQTMTYTAVTASFISGNEYQFTFGAGVNTGDEIRYYIVAQDLATPNPNVGAAPSGGAAGFSINPPVAATPPTNPSSYSIVQSIAGTFTVGTSKADYPSLTGDGGLFADINAKVVTGDITALIVSDIAEPGTHALNQWAEEGTGNYTLTVKPNEATMRTLSGSSATTLGLIRINGADRVVFDGSFGRSNGRYLTIQNLSTLASTAAIQVISLGTNAGSENVTIKNCIIAAGSNSVTSTFGIFAGGAIISTTGTGAHNNNLRILNNHIYKAYYAVYARGVATTGLLTGLEISDNVIGSDDPNNYVLFRGVDIQNATAPIISGNEIYNLIVSTGVNNAGIDLGANVTDAMVSANLIHGIYSTSSTGYGAYGINISATTTSNIMIVNNVIYDLITANYSITSTTWNAFGIRITGGTNHKVYYNSVNLFGNVTSGTSAGMSAAFIVTVNTATGLDVRNNIFANSTNFLTAGSKSYAAYVVTGTVFGTINYNDYYASGTHGILGFFGADKPTLAEWQASTGQDVNSLAVNPTFNNNSMLQLLLGSPLIGAGTPIAGIGTDINGLARSAANPTIGAYETASDGAPPTIVYTPLGNTTATEARTLLATITDVSGVPATAPGWPHLYWKKTGDAGYSAVAPSAVNGNVFTYNFGAVPEAGVLIEYYIVARDMASPPNIGAFPAGGAGNYTYDPPAAGTPPTTPSSYTIIGAPLSGDYLVGTSKFSELSGKSITFIEKTRIVEEVMTLNEFYLNPEKYETASPEVRLAADGTVITEEIEDPGIPQDVQITVKYEQTYHVPYVNGVEYTGALFMSLENNNRDGIKGVYATITAALNDAKLRGIGGAVRFLLTDATYPSETFPIVLEPVTGMSASNTISILPNTGVTSLITFAHNLPIIRFLGSSYYILDGRQNGVSNPGSLTIQNTNNSAAGHVVQFIDGSTYNQLNYLNLSNNGAATAGNGVINFSTSATNPTGNSNNLVKGCELIGGRSGILMSGTLANPNNLNLIENCKIRDFGFAGVWISGNTNNTTIRSNELYNTTVGIAVAHSGLNIGAVGGVNEISGNKIYDLQNTSTSTIRGITISGAVGSVWNIYNNFFSFRQDNGTKTSIYAFQNSGANEVTCNFYYNSIYLGGTHTGGTAGQIISAGFVKGNTGTTATHRFKNNIVANVRSGGTAGTFHTGTFIGNVAGNMDVDYNVHWAANGVTNWHAGWAGTIYSALADYKAAAAPHEQKAIFKNTNFVSASDLHLAGASIGDYDLIGLPIAGITTDIDGDVRGTTYPYRGADEATLLTPPLGSLTGVVTKASNRTPISGARVYTDGYEAFTDENGVYVIAEIIADVYDFSCKAEDYLTSVVLDYEVIVNVTNTLNFILDYGEVSVNPASLEVDLLPGAVGTRTVTVTNSGTGALTWNAYATLLVDFGKDAQAVNKLNGDRKAQTYQSETDPDIKTASLEPNRGFLDLQGYFPVSQTTGHTQYSVATDGQYIYSAAWNTNPIAKYSMNGTYISSFEIAGAGNLRDLTYDGQYFYGSSNANAIYKMDFTNQVLIETINVTPTGNTIRGIAYDADNDAFWVTSASFSGPFKLISRAGATLQTLATAVGSVSGLAWDNVSEGGPYLWAYTQNAPGHVLHKINLTTGASLLSFDVNSYGILEGASAGGLVITDKLADGLWALMGISQNEGVWVLALNSTWLSVTPTSGVIQPGQSADLTVGFDASVVDEGTYNGRVVINHDGQELAEGSLEVLVTMNAYPPCPKPQNLTLSNILATSAVFGWTPYGEETSWNVKVVDNANNIVLEEQVESTSYNILDLSPESNYSAYVQAVCGEPEFDNPKVDRFWIEIDAFNAINPANSGGAPVNEPGEDGIWYLYTDPETGLSWYNVWFYNDPLDLSRMKKVMMGFWVERSVPFTPGNVRYVVNWSTPNWQGTGFPTPMDEAFIERSPVNGPSPVNFGAAQWFEMEFEIPDYNPEWVSVDIFGTNIRIPSTQMAPPVSSPLYDWWTPANGAGILVHECLPKPNSAWAGPKNFLTLPLCPVPSGLTATNITPTSAVLNWTAGLGETMWNLKYGAPGFDPATQGTLVEGITGKPYLLSGLTQNTSYEYRVQADCGSGDVSAWSVAKAFSTPCAAIQLPFAENFNEVAVGAIPPCWSRTHANWGAFAGTNAGGVANEMMFNWSPSATTAFRLVTPPLDGTTKANYQLTFKHLIDYFAVPATYKVQGSLDGNTWSDLWSVVNPPANVGPETVTIPLTGLSGNVFYLAWVYDGNSFNTDNWYVDDIAITEITYPVTFNVDITTAQGFTHGTDLVYLAGDFPGASWNEPGTNPNLLMSRVGTTDVYTLTLNLPAGDYQYKYFRNAGWGGGEWGGDPNRTLTVSGATTRNEVFGGIIEWANLQWPPDGTIAEGGSFNVYGQAYINGLTWAAGATYGLEAWVGISTTNTDPSGWGVWIPASFNSQEGNNDQFVADIAAGLTPGTYYYAYRYRFGQIFGTMLYGGYSGGFWDGVSNVSGILTVNPAGPPLTFTAIGPLDDCYDALETITIQNATVSAGAIAEFKAGINIVASFFDVFLGGTADLKAGNNIVLGEGVHFASGSNVHLGIMTTVSYCAKASAIVAVKAEEPVPAVKLATQDVQEAMFTVFPNPTTGRFTLQMREVDENTVINVEIFGMMGDRVLQNQLFGQKQYEFDLSASPRGVYIVRVLQGTETGVMRVIKQ